METHLPSYARPAPRLRLTVTRTFALKALALLIALCGLLLIDAARHVYSTPDSLGIAYNDLGGVDVIGPRYQPAIFVCYNGPLAQVLWFWREDC